MRRVFIDLSPPRRSRDLRYLVLDELVPVLGTQLTTVAVPYQLTRSSPACSAGLAINADLGTALWPLFVLPALAGCPGCRSRW
jgi:hypothetical protein